MSMNLFNISKEIKKINSTLNYLKDQNNTILEQVDNYSIVSLSDEIKNNMEDIYNRIENLKNFNINCKFKYQNKNYDEIHDFLKSINVDHKTINEIIFLDFNSLNEILLEDDEVFTKLDISLNDITFIKNKIQEKIYTTSVEV